MVQRNQLWILLLFFVVVGVFSGVAIWQINQMQQTERELARVRNDLAQATQQTKILREQTATTLTAKSKLQKNFDTAKKQLAEAIKQGIALENQLKTVQTQSTALSAENSSLKVKLAAAERQIAALEKSIKSTASTSKKADAEPLLPMPR
ncbi:MAG TPA: hypothetical protein V6D19_03900 [Stenomitos sp.]